MTYPEEVAQGAWSGVLSILGVVKQVLAGAAALGALGYFLIQNDMVRGPMAEILGVEDLNATLETTLRQLQATQEIAQKNTQALELITLQLDEITKQRAIDSTPPVTFSGGGHSITPMDENGRVKISWTLVKNRDCGRPKVAMSFRNGGGLQHYMQSLSVLSDDGRGVNLPVSTIPVTINYSGRVPQNDGVQPGRGYAQVILSDFEDCPDVRTIYSPVVDFIISDNGYLDE